MVELVYTSVALAIGLARHCTRATRSGPNYTRSRGVRAASCARVRRGCARAFGPSWTMLSGLLCREPGSDAGCGSLTTLAGRVCLRDSVWLNAITEKKRDFYSAVPRLNPFTLKNTQIPVFSCILCHRKAGILEAARLDITTHTHTHF